MNISALLGGIFSNNSGQSVVFQLNGSRVAEFLLDENDFSPLANNDGYSLNKTISFIVSNVDQQVNDLVVRLVENVNGNVPETDRLQISSLQVNGNDVSASVTDQDITTSDSAEVLFDGNGVIIAEVEGFQAQSFMAAAAPSPGAPASIDLSMNEADPTAASLGGATISGTAGVDRRIGGTNGDDVIEGLGGVDTIRGNDGNDGIVGDGGDDRLYGGDGDDTMAGGADNDLLQGQDGADRLFGGDGDDRLFGGNDNDTIYGGAGSDRLLGQNGDDILLGKTGDDYLNGGAGADQISGGADNDFLSGNAGNDTLWGDGGDDVLYGNAGDDILVGGAGEDKIFGDIGNDTIYGGDDADVLLGRQGNDTVYGDGGADIIYDEEGDDFLNGGDGGDALIGGVGADRLDGDAGDDTLHGNGLGHVDIYAITSSNPNIVYNAASNSFYQLVSTGGNISWDAARAAAQASVLNGVQGHLANITSASEHNFLVTNVYAGNNTFIGGADYLNEGEWVWEEGAEAGLNFSSGGTAVGSSYVNWTAGQPNDSDGTQDYLYVLNTNDQWADALVQGGGGFVNITDYVIEWDAGFMSDDNAADTLNGGTGNDFLYGYGGNDILSGGADNDFIFGHSGSDIINGDSGNDTIFGGSGADTIDGGAGDDIIHVGEQVNINVNADTLLSYAGAQDAGGAINFMDDGVGVELDGNLWKKFYVDYTVTANTVVEFDFRSTNEAEISGIGFDNDDNISADLTVQIWGTQNWANTNLDNYSGGGEWQHYSINIGSVFTGSFSHLTLINDDDGGGNDGEGYFRNIVIHEGNNEADSVADGDGQDILYMDDGVDSIIFDALSAFNDIDEVRYFNQTEDILDISDLLSNWTPGHPQRGDIGNYLEFSNNGDHTVVSVDTNGNSGGNNYVAIAELYGQNDLDVYDMFSNGQIIV